MIKIEEIISPAAFGVLSVFNPGRIAKEKKEIALFNKKTSSFLKSVEKIKIDFKGGTK